jgi:C4-dicarboxylate-specific signal transduction histidine kinase
VDDTLVFIDEDTDDSSHDRWKILVVDDDESVHAITKVALQNKFFDGKKLELINAMSAQEAKELLNQHDDIVMALIDVMMETPDAGLQLVNYIRHDLKNTLIRLILRTGQPDQVPEDEILDRYDINDYKEKTELTSQKLYTLVRISIKQYEQLTRLQYQEKLLLIKTRNAQMGEMLSMIAHQWRQPLSSISSIINNIKVKLITQEYTEEVLLEKSDEAEQLIQHLSKTISDFRTFFLPDKKKSSFLIQSVLDKSLEIIRSSLELKNINVIVNNRSTSNITSFENELQQVLLNILKNAQDALEINKVEKSVITINCFDEGNKTYIQILDNAGGINPSVIDNVFDPYFTTKENTNGTGLGLYMSKIIIDEHCKGEISVKNASEGALFSIALDLESDL